MEGEPIRLLSEHAEFARLIRVYRAHCDIADLIRSESDERRFLQEFCDILVRSGAYVMAWVGFRGEDPAKTVIPQAHAGAESGYLEDVFISWEDRPEGGGPTGTAIRTGHPCFITDYSDPRVEPWREEALRRGFRSSAALPLVDGDHVYGSLSVYSPVEGTFDVEEVRILQRMVRLLEFGIKVFRAEGRKNEALAASRQREAELTAILDHIVDGVFVCDAAGKLTLVNAAGLRLLEMSSIRDSERIQWAIREGFLPAPVQGRSEAGNESLGHALRGENVGLMDEKLQLAPDEPELTLRTSAGSIKDGEGRIIGAVKVARDVTELVEFEKLKDDFIAVAAHELKTPVTITKGYAQALQLRVSGLPPSVLKMAEAIERNSDRIARIVGQLLDFIQLHTGTFILYREVFDLTSLLREAIQHASSLSHRHVIELVESVPASIDGDRQRLLQVLEHLIGNAVKCSPRGDVVQLRARREGDRVIISVQDHGVGIPRSKQARIFERLYRAHTGTPMDFGGTGIGLFLVRELVQRHGGETWFVSEEGVGSTFFLSLPIHRRA